MSYFLRLRQRDQTPEPKRDTVAIIAAEDGTLQQMDEDGNVTDLSGGGNGGSQSVKSATVTVTSAQILALDMTPVTIVAGVADTALFPIQVIGSGGGDTVTLYTTAGDFALITEGAFALSATLDKLKNLLLTGNDSGGDVSFDAPSNLSISGNFTKTGITGIVGKSLQLFATSPVADGDFDVDVTVLYQEVTVA